MKPNGSEQVAVLVELFGVPRLRAGRPTCTVTAGSIGDAMAALETQCPQLSGTVLANGWPLPAYRLSLNGNSFVTDRAVRLHPGDSLILLAADAGG
jgi:molybdopterin synthase sulfur carrier subunit